MNTYFNEITKKPDAQENGKILYKIPFGAYTGNGDTGIIFVWQLWIELANLMLQYGVHRHIYRRLIPKNSKGISPHPHQEFFCKCILPIGFFLNKRNIIFGKIVAQKKLFLQLRHILNGSGG